MTKKKKENQEERSNIGKIIYGRLQMIKKKSKKKVASESEEGD